MQSRYTLSFRLLAVAVPGYEVTPAHDNQVTLRTCANLVQYGEGQLVRGSGRLCLLERSHNLRR